MRSQKTEINTDRARSKSGWARAESGLVGGVCQGIGRHVGVSPWILRALVVYLLWFKGLGAFLYLALFVSLPGQNQPAQDAKILGVAPYIAAKSGVSVGLIRLWFILSTVFLFGLGLLVYLGLYYKILKKTAY